MLRVLSADEMKRVDRHAIEKAGLSGAVLMESAGRSVFAHLRDRLGGVRGKRVVVLSGPGANGGDGFVVARYLALGGAEVVAALVGTRRPAHGDAERNFSVFRKLGFPVISVLSAKDLRRLSGPFDAVVDALFGIGLARPPEGLFAACVRWINAQKAPVWAVDLPSGLNADTGRVLGAAVRADTTVTFGFKKRGFYLNDGPEFCGDVVRADISLADAWAEQTRASDLFEIEARDFAGLLKPRKRRNHKGTFGHVLVVAGSPQKSGAAVLASRAALRTGAGLVTLAVPESAHRIVKSRLVEVMTESLPDDGHGRFTKEALKPLLELARGKSVLAVGPGLLPGPVLSGILRGLFGKTRMPVVLDADGLNTFGPRIGNLKPKAGRFVLTPHPGEMARLTGLSGDAVQADRIGIAVKFARKLRATVVLKGAFSVIAQPDGTAYLNPTGNPGMATAGTGDVLTGMIAGMIAQGVDPGRAAAAGVWLHGRAGDQAAEKIGGRGLLAGDLMDEIPRALRAFP